jgi:hypothetical protein
MIRSWCERSMSGCSVAAQPDLKPTPYANMNIKRSRQPPEPRTALAPLARDAKTPENLAPRARGKPERSPILSRAPASLTAHAPSSTVSLDEKGDLFFLYSLYSQSYCVS